MATEQALSFDPSWDERARGPRMTAVVGKTIWKYQLPVLERFILRLPEGAEIIRIADQGGMLWAWAVVDTEAPLVERSFRAFKTGVVMPEPEDVTLTYLGWAAIHVQMELALYFFEEHRITR
jgi:hypothetical protein